MAVILTSLTVIISTVSVQAPAVRLGSRDKQAARAGAECFRSAVAAQKFVAGNQRMEMSICIGVFALGTVSHCVTAKNVVDATDIALFSAKNAGRHCIVVQH